MTFVRTGQGCPMLAIAGSSLFQPAPASSTTNPPKDTAKPISQGGGTSVKPYLKGLKMPDGERRRREHKVRNNRGNTKVRGGGGAP